MALAAQQSIDLAQAALLDKSHEELERKAKFVRQRPAPSIQAIENLELSGDVPSMWAALKPQLVSALRAITRTQKIDQDELEVLWWMYNRHSVIFKKHLSDLSPFDVALAASIELADRGLCPSPNALRGIVHGQIATCAKKQASSGKTLKSIITGWTPDIIAALFPKDTGVKELAVQCPKALPLTWIAVKVHEAGVATGWDQEYSARTGYSASLKLTPDEFADQVLTERTAQRLLADFTGE